MKNKFSVILGVAVLSLMEESAFTQGMGPTPALQNNWSYTTPTEAFQMSQQSMAPIQNAVNTYGQRQFDMTVQLQQQAFAAQQQQRQLQADAAAQQRQLDAEKSIAAMQEKMSQERLDQATIKAQENAAAIQAEVKKVADDNQARIEKGREAIEGLAKDSK